MKRFLSSLALVALVAGLPVAFGTTSSTKVKGPAPLKISHGQTVDLADYMVPGKTMVFDFTSKFCPPCERISPLLDQLHAGRADVAVVKVDINRPDVRGIDWKSPVAQQYALRGIPHFKIYGPDGKLVAEGDKAYGMVREWISPMP